MHIHTRFIHIHTHTHTRVNTHTIANTYTGTSPAVSGPRSSRRRHSSTNSGGAAASAGECVCQCACCCHVSACLCGCEHMCIRVCASVHVYVCFLQRIQPACLLETWNNGTNLRYRWTHNGPCKDCHGSSYIGPCKDLISSYKDLARTLYLHILDLARTVMDLHIRTLQGPYIFIYNGPCKDLISSYIMDLARTVKRIHS